MMIAPGERHIPTHTRTDITDSLHEAFGFRADYQITSRKNFKSDEKEAKIATNFMLKRFPQTAYSCWL